eukprot:UN09912
MSSYKYERDANNTNAQLLGAPDMDTSWSTNRGRSFSARSESSQTSSQTSEIHDFPFERTESAWQKRKSIINHVEK